MDKAFLAAGELFRKADGALQRRNYPAAEEPLRELLKLDPENPDTNERLGDVCARTDRPDEARRYYEVRIRDYRRGLKEEPGSAATHDDFARFLLERKLESGEALAAAKRAVELEPDGAGFHHTLAEVYFLLGRVPEAVAHGRQAAELAPDRRDYRDSLQKYQAPPGRK